MNAITQHSFLPAEPQSVSREGGTDGVLFAGGGGSSEGYELAIGMSPDWAVNHDADALAMHRINHPNTRHYCANVWQVRPSQIIEDFGGKPINRLWASPDCKHFSKAKGGKPVERHIRDLAWVVLTYADLPAHLRPLQIFLENVEEFKDWCRLVTVDGKLIPDKKRKGETFNSWVREFRKRGYTVEWREIRAKVYGTPTIRKRLYVVMRCDGLPIVWPEDTHGVDAKPFKVAADCIDWSLPCHSIFLTKEEAKAVGVKRPLADATMARIARGIKRYVIDAAANGKRPFIVNLTHQGSDRVEDIDAPFNTTTAAHRGEKALLTPIVTYAQQGGANRDPADPLHTLTASRKDGNYLVTPHLMTMRNAQKPYNGADEPTHSITSGGAHLNLVTATLINTRNGEREGQAPRVRNILEPAPTVTGKGSQGAIAVAHITKFHGGATGSSMQEPMPTTTANSFIKRPGGAPPLGVVSAFLAQHNTERNGGVKPGHDVREPFSTLTASGSHQTVVTSHMLSLHGNDLRDGQTDEPLQAICAGGGHAAEVRAFLVKYFGTAIGQDLDDPLHTVTEKDRLALVTVTIDGEPYVIVDIGMRMLTPRELFRAQGFGDDYTIDYGLYAANDSFQKRGGKGVLVLIGDVAYFRRPLTRTAQIKMCGNSVCPPVAAALIAANDNGPAKRLRMAA